MSKKRASLIIGVVGLVGLVALAAATGTLSLQVNAWSHSPVMAAEAAEEFADVAFVEGDVGRAYSLIDPAIEDEVTVDELATVIEQMHPTGRPELVRAIEFQRLPGYRGMNVFLEGEAGSATFHYRLLMDGTATSGYEVKGFWRGSGPYPNPEDRESIR